MQDLHIVDEHPLPVLNIRSLEEMCRFVIISYHDGFFFKDEGFVEK
jgi:hypothetical protein